MRENPFEKPIIPLEQVHHNFPVKWLPDLIRKHWDALNAISGELVPLRLGAGGFGVVFAVKGKPEVVKVTSDEDEAAIVERLLASPVLGQHPGVVRIYGMAPLFKTERTKNRAWAIHEELLLPVEYDASRGKESWHWPLLTAVNSYNGAICDKPWGTFWTAERYVSSVLERVKKLAQIPGAAQVAEFLLWFWQHYGVFLEDVHLDNLGRRTSNGPLVLFDLRIYQAKTCMRAVAP